MNRRTLLKAAAALPLLRIGTAFAADLPPLAVAARDAFIFALPLIEMARTRAQMAALPANRLFHKRVLATPQDVAVTTPNNDTLYSSAWLNLANGPVRLTIPPSGDRYLSVALMDMYTNNVAVLGTRTIGAAGGTVTIVGPGAASTDSLAVRATTNWVWLLVRTLVDGEADLAAAHAVQDGFRLEGPTAPGPGRTFADRAAPWDKLLETIQALIVESPPQATDERLIAAIAPLGIGVGGGFDAGRFTASQAAEIEQGLAAARASLRGQGWTGPVADGWSYPRANLGVYGQDYLYRAQVALGGLGALPRAEALYIRALDPAGRGVYAPGTRSRLRLPAKLPLDGFWSLTLYRATPEGQFFFAENPIRRYAIGDRTPGLVRGADGSLDILIAADDPGEGQRANWLPAPAAEPYGLFFRAYLPRAELLDGGFHLPRLERG